MSDTQLILNELKLLRELIDERCPPKKKPKKGTASPNLGKHKYGELKHVMLTDNEFSELLKLWGQDALEYGIRVLDEYIEQSGKSYKSHAFMLRCKWPSERITEYLNNKPSEGRSLWS